MNFLEFNIILYFCIQSRDVYLYLNLMTMTDILLLAEQQSQLVGVAIWALLLMVLAVSVILIFWQLKAGRELSSDLEQLGKLEKHNVQNEFVLKALCIATWHMDVTTKEVIYDYDFRERNNQWIYDASMTNGSVNEDLLLLHEQDAERVGRSLMALCEGKIDMYHEEYRVKIPNTDHVYWEESYATVSVFNEDGSPKTIVGTSKRIDDRKTMEKALIEARYKAEESNRLKTAFLANMSHEIRTPLNAIVGFTSLLPDVQEAEERKMLLDLVNENTQKLLRIVDDVVSISKMEAGQDELILSTFDLPIVLRDIMAQFTPKLNPGVEMSTQFACAALNVTSDRGRLQEIVRHLVSNAVKFTENGSVVVGFDEPHEGRIKIWVKDTGKGIAPEFHEKVFERFFKVDEFIPGAGLGLSSSRAMAYSLGGSIEVTSQLGQGSTFTLETSIQ